MRPKRSLLIALLAACLIPTAAAATAKKSSQDFIVGLTPTEFSAYSIGGSNYVRARDFAAALDYSLVYDPSVSAIFLDTTGSYVSDGSTRAPATARTATATPTRQTVYIDGYPAEIGGYSIGGYNYFNLRDLGRALDCSILYNGVLGRIEIDPTRPYFEKNRNTIVYMYHAFTEDPALLAAHPDLYTSPWKLRCDIRDMRALGYECISLEDYYHGKAEKGKKYFIITIDDGYLNNYTLAYPVLVEEKAPASIFTVVREMENGASNYFTAAQAREMEASGYIKVYSHALDHDYSTRTPLAEFERQLGRAYTSLQTALGEKEMFLAYPYGDYNASTYLAVRNHGFRLQMVQTAKFQADDLIVRQNVWYDSAMRLLVKKAYHN